MRQVLFRIRLEPVWSLDPINDVTAIGIGFLFLIWTACGLWWLIRGLKTPTAPAAERFSSLWLWLSVSVVGIAARSWFLSRGLLSDGLPVYGYGFMLFLGFLVAGWNASRRARRVGIAAELIWDLGMWVFFTGIAGARLFYIVQYSDRVFGGKTGLSELLFAAVNLPDGGLVFYGGAILSTAAYLVFCRRRRLDPLLMADVLAPSILIGLAFGRVGCFLNGCCYGDPSHLAWAVHFPKDSVPFAALVGRGLLDEHATVSLSLHPTQIYSSLNALVLAWLTATWFRIRRRRGTVLALAMVAYSITRFLIEFLRGDEPGQFHTMFTISQWVSLGLLVAGIVLWVWLLRRPVEAADLTATSSSSSPPKNSG